MTVLVRLVLAAVAMAAGVLGVTTALGTQPEREAASTVVQVVAILDGDTLRVRTATGEDLERVRLLGIDAPEVARHPDPADCYADAATDTLVDLVPIGTTVLIVDDRTQGDRDTYGRLLRYVDHAGHDVARQLLEEGAARLYRESADLTRGADYRTTAAGAQRLKRGLWGACWPRPLRRWTTDQPVVIARGLTAP